jgi:hypothetical protein
LRGYTNSLGTSLTKVQFNTISIDNNAEYDATNHRVTVKNAGTYVVFAMAGNISQGVQETRVTLEIQKNGSAIADAYGTEPAAALGNSHVDSEIMVSMAVNDYVELFVTKTGNGTLSSADNEFWFQVTRIA